MRIYIHILSCAAFVLLLACSHISDDERLIYVKPTKAVRCVLLEDFTGQRCINCPKASEEIQLLHTVYSEESVVAVAIHSGPLGFRTNDRFMGLSTDIGDSYYDYWNIEHQPVGLVNRGGLLEYKEWSARIREELQKSSPVTILLKSIQEDANKLTIHAEVMATDNDIKGKFQLWVVEDSVSAFQLMPDGTRNDSYIHRHVFRTSINGLWGDEISISGGETITRNYSVKLREEWVMENLSVVGFIYSDKEVLQTVEIDL